jgi:mono/diheme cytochrome c family protein
MTLSPPLRPLPHRSLSRKSPPLPLRPLPLAAPAEAAPAEAAPAEAAARTGEQVYAQVCIACHQANGEGLPGAFPSLVGSDWVTGDYTRPTKIVIHGLQGEIEVKGTTYNSIMTPQGSILSDAEIANVLTHVRSSWGNAADAVTTEQVTAIRTANADRTAPWTVAELNAK